ncbi:MAG: bifunctional diguanylate cyclase/phosphodiesterase [Pseudomonadota bacterium]
MSTPVDPVSTALALPPGEPLADRLADLLARVTPRGELLFLSSGGRAWLGLGEGAAPRGSRLAALLAPQDQDGVAEALALAACRPRQKLAAGLCRADGTCLPATCRILPLAGPGGRPEVLFAAWELADPSPVRSEGGGMEVDPLTGLPTRARLMGDLADLIRTAARPGEGFALLHLGLDDFQKVNEALGHAAGDRLLVQAAERLVAQVRAGDRVLRAGGDEFTVLLAGTRDREAVLGVVRKLQAALQRPFALGDSQPHLTASVGIALYPEHGGDGPTLFKCADIALSQAKAQGRNRWEFCRPGAGSQASRRMALEEQMYAAVQNGVFEMHYQPIWRAADRLLVGVEALMRWRRPGEGFVPPVEFIPLAEANGLIGFLGAWSLRASCHQVAHWNQTWGVKLRASVNLSPVQFHQGDVAHVVAQALAESGLPAGCLSLEITEGILMHDPIATEAVLHRLRDLGAGISVDDFGTGYSSLAYLKRFPLNTLKIDRSFVADLESDGNDQAIVEAVLGLARALGFSVVAEGVETEAQLAHLARRGCDMIQGYLLGRPLTAEELTRKVENGEWHPVR